MDLAEFDRRPIVIAIAGPNGAGKTTFFHSYLASAGLRFVCADILADELELQAYEAARLADNLRRALVARQESFVFETVFSDPVGDKIAFLEEAVLLGYEVVLCYIGLSSPEESVDRVSLRASQGGHDVPLEKLRSRYPRTLANLRAAILRLPRVIVYDNRDLSDPFRIIADFKHGKLDRARDPVPEWLRSVIP